MIASLKSSKVKIQLSWCELSNEQKRENSKMKGVGIGWLLGLYFYGLHFTHAVTSTQKLTCLQAIMPYMELSIQSNNYRLQQALSVLLEDHSNQEPLGSHPIGEVLADFTVTPSQNAFVQTHIDRVYKLNPTSAWILNLSILRTSLSPINKQYLREKWSHFINDGKKSELEKSKQERLIDEVLSRTPLSNQEEDMIFRSPYVDSLVLRNVFILLKDPNYQTMLTLGERKRQVTGFLSYKNGSSQFLEFQIHLKDVFIFFETYKRIYVFQVTPLNNLSENILVFEKKPSQHHLIAGNLYYEYFQELQSYFYYAPFNLDDQILSFVLDDLAITTVMEKNSSFFDRLVHRLMDVQNIMNIPPRSTVGAVIQHYQAYKSIRISTILKIKHQLGVDLSVLLSDVDLRPYVKLDPNRPSLSKDYILAFEQAIKSKLRRILQRSGLTSEEVAGQPGLIENTIRYITSTRTRLVGKYATLKKILDVLGKDTNQFLVEVDTRVSRHISHHQPPAEDQNSVRPFAFIGDRILQAMFLFGVDSGAGILRVLKVHKNQLGQSDPTLKLLLRVSHKTRVPLALLVSKDSLKEHVDPQVPLEETDVTAEEIEKARQLIVYYIRRKMVELNVPLLGLVSLNSQPREVTLRALLNGQSTPRYLLLTHIAEALRTTLPELLKDFETDMANFESLDLDIEIPKSRNRSISESAKNELQRWVQRMIQAVRLTNITTKILRNKFHIVINQLTNHPYIPIQNIFRVARVAGISEAQLLGHEDLSQIINPHRNRQNIRPISKQAVQRKMRTLRKNIEVYRDAFVKKDHPWRADIYENPHLPIVEFLQLAEDIQTNALLFFTSSRPSMSEQIHNK